MSSNEVLEYELTFLASYIPAAVRRSSFKELKDVYFPEDIDVHPRLRLRKLADRYQLTKKTQKSEGDASTHIETSIALERQEYDALADKSKRVVEKTRYFYEHDGQVAEFDVFKGDLAGLVLVDFEFKSRAELLEFKAPDFCLADVTQEAFIAGGLLAGKAYGELQPKLMEFGYNSLD
ncbi:hypothetical protein ACQU0X_21210 [Pseudovibrio ascidiaceicola]|uniref:hypothetical protein n=1 Tax=Pseudovibrio ascidiaceicola TaxID=285279 RepID=UPI003D35CA97